MDSYPKFLPTCKSYKKCILIILLLIAIYVFENSSIKTYFEGAIFTYVIIPLLWIGISVVIWVMPNTKANTKLKDRRYIYSWSFYFGIIYVLITVFFGFFDGLGKSPYSHTPKGIITNIIFIGSTLIGREFARSYLLNSLSKKENYFVFIVISLFMTITNFSINKYVQLNSLEKTVKFFAESFAPEFSQNIFSSYLVYLGGYKVSIIYLSMIKGFHWVSPILPNLKWINTALIGILSPIFFLMIFKSIYIAHTKQFKKMDKESESIISWIFTSIISIGIIWFAVGVFPIYPSVIATGSMEPKIMPGDIILVEKASSIDYINNLNINDVIQFKRDGILISHRIIDIVDGEEGAILFKTKGDNNSAPDTNLVKPQDIKGEIKYIIPKIGWLTLFLKSNKDIALDEIVF